jgi:hypothetical protein
MEIRSVLKCVLLASLGMSPALASAAEAPAKALSEVVGTWKHNPAPREAVSSRAFKWRDTFSTSTEFNVTDDLKAVETQRKATLKIDADGTFALSVTYQLPETTKCFIQHETDIRGRASVANGKLTVDIKQGFERKKRSGTCDGKSAPQEESLAGKRRVFEAWFQNGTLFKLRPYEPKGPIINAMNFTR